MKKCPCCKLELDNIFFSKGSAKDGLQSYCKDCTKKRNRKANPICLEQPNLSELNEIWKDIEGYENQYQVSNLGNIKSLNRVFIDSMGRDVFKFGKILSQNINKKNGYCSVMFGYKGKRKYVHRLVASAFIKNPENKLCINHKNKVRNDNKVENLEWVTYLENNNHSKTFRAFK